MTVKELFVKLFQLVSVLFGICFVAALIYQIYYVFSTGQWRFLTVYDLVNFDSYFMLSTNPLVYVPFLLLKTLPLLLVLGWFAYMFKLLAVWLD